MAPQIKGEKSLDSVVHIVGCTFFLPRGLSFYKTLINGDSVDLSYFFGGRVLFLGVGLRDNIVNRRKL